MAPSGNIHVPLAISGLRFSCLGTTCVELLRATTIKLLKNKLLGIQFFADSIANKL